MPLSQYHQTLLSIILLNKFSVGIIVLHGAKLAFGEDLQKCFRVAFHGQLGHFPAKQHNTWWESARNMEDISSQFLVSRNIQPSLTRCVCVWRGGGSILASQDVFWCYSETIKLSDFSYINISTENAKSNRRLCSSTICNGNYICRGGGAVQKEGRRRLGVGGEWRGRCVWQRVPLKMNTNNR